MNKERRFYIAYEVCKFLNNREPNNRKFEEWELAMYVAELAECIEYAEQKQDGAILKQYYDILHEELKENVLCYGKYAIERVKVKQLIKLLDEWKD